MNLYEYTQNISNDAICYFYLNDRGEWSDDKYTNIGLYFDAINITNTEIHRMNKNREFLIFIYPFIIAFISICLLSCLC